MKNKLSVVVFIILILIFLFSQPSLGIESGIESGKCKDCHGNVKPIPSGILTKDCAICHNGDHSQNIAPVTRIPERVHWIHGNIRKKSDRKDCQECHRYGPIECIKCHNSHENTGPVKIQTFIIDMSNMSACIQCHGNLPQPGGHDNFRNSLSNSKHEWMNCRTCHLNVYNRVGNGVNNFNDSYKFELHFGDLSIISIDNSIDLCKICHSLQYKGLKEGTHGGTGKTCIDCHNPHTTKFGAMVQITPKETPVNISTRMESTGNWITTKVPILKNTVAMIIIILIIAMTVAEHFLSKDEEGKKTTYDTIKVRGNEDKLKTLEVKLRNQGINIINDMLETSGINILGMTMTKEEDKEENIYKYVIFMNMEEPIDEKVLTDKIIAMDYVKSAIFTDKYEL